MISKMIIDLLQITSSRALTRNAVALRNTIVIVVLGIYFFLIIALILKNRNKGKKRIIFAYCLSVLIIIEMVILLPSIHGIKHVPLEYVCSVETTYNKEQNDRIKWYTNYLDYSRPSTKKELEESFGCDLSKVEFDEQYTYLFVYYYKDVDLFYSEWSKMTDNCIPPQTVFWIGNLDVRGDTTDNRIFIYKFTGKMIAPYW